MKNYDKLLLKIKDVNFTIKKIYFSLSKIN